MQEPRSAIFHLANQQVDYCAQRSGQRHGSEDNISTAASG